jgi:uncharacterized protein YggU (UPF0235/DUF167 family)
MLRLPVAAHPAARHDAVELDSSTLHVWVRAKPLEGKANTAIEHAIAAALGLKPRQVRLVLGRASRHKLVEVDLPEDTSETMLRERLMAHAVRTN